MVIDVGRRSGTKEEEAVATVQGTVGEEDARGAELDEHAPVTGVVEGPCPGVGVAVVAGASPHNPELPFHGVHWRHTCVEIKVKMAY
jgi:hypothetical protein